MYFGWISVSFIRRRFWRPLQPFLATLEYLRTPRRWVARQSQISCSLQWAMVIRGKKRKEKKLCCRNMCGGVWEDCALHRCVDSFCKECMCRGLCLATLRSLWNWMNFPLWRFLWSPHCGKQNPFHWYGQNVKSCVQGNRVIVSLVDQKRIITHNFSHHSKL